MKRISITLLVAALLLTLCACGSAAETEAAAPAFEYSMLDSMSEEELVALKDVVDGKLAAMTEPEAEAEEPVVEAEAVDPTVEMIDFTAEEGRIVFAGIEKARGGLTEFPNVLVVSFDFTSYMEDPIRYSTPFSIHFFQHDVELLSETSYNNAGGEQYYLCQAGFDFALKDAPMRFGRVCVLEDDSPLTIMVKQNPNEDGVYQMMVVDIAELNLY